MTYFSENLYAPVFGRTLDGSYSENGSLQRCIIYELVMGRGSESDGSHGADVFLREGRGLNRR